MTRFGFAALVMVAMAGCSDGPSEPPAPPVGPITAGTFLGLEGVVVGDGVPQAGAVLDIRLLKNKGPDPGYCGSGGWQGRGSFETTTDANGEFSVTLFESDELGGPAGRVALEVCLLVMTSLDGSAWSEHFFPDVQVIWGRADQLNVTLDVSHLLPATQPLLRRPEM